MLQSTFQNIFLHVMTDKQTDRSVSYEVNYKSVGSRFNVESVGACPPRNVFDFRCSEIYCDYIIGG